MGSGVRVVDLSLYLATRDTQHTFRLSGPRARVHSLAREQQQEGGLCCAANVICGFDVSIVAQQIEIASS
jgi:hypothetical protein